MNTKDVLAEMENVSDEITKKDLGKSWGHRFLFWSESGRHEKNPEESKNQPANYCHGAL